VQLLVYMGDYTHNAQKI